MKPYHRKLVHDSIAIIAMLLIALWAHESFSAEPTKHQLEKQEAKRVAKVKQREERRNREVKYEACLTQCREKCK